ncbi:MAG: LuxR C-terminal-related transcriptional regulator [Lewinella sp.]|jgi:DNA-binding NarL/FixJ family response regulator|uniref:LuxR C-terminal-related transcriptional regulator n=1 Tax=Lewinella sp. TaxID=2004506 RepID=UPI003D6B6A70
MEANTTIAIADPQLLSRAGIKHLLSQNEGLVLLFESTREEELFSQLKVQQPNILVIDYDHSPHFSANTVHTVIKNYPDIQLLIITDDDRRHQILRLLESGVKTFITKACNEEEVEDAILAAVRKEKFFCAKVLDYLLERSASQASPDITILSPREIEIVSLIAKGLVAKEIAAELHLSTHTVYTHRKNILKKLNLRSSSELLVFALQNNLVTG